MKLIKQTKIKQIFNTAENLQSTNNLGELMIGTDKKQDEDKAPQNRCQEVISCKHGCP